MKKIAILALVICLGAFMLVGCGCMNTKADVPTLPTNGESSEPSRPETTVPSTAAPTTMPTTAATEAPTESTGMMEGAMDDIMGGSTDDATGPVGENGNARSRGTIIPRG